MAKTKTRLEQVTGSFGPTEVVAESGSGTTLIAGGFQVVDDRAVRSGALAAGHQIALSANRLVSGTWGTSITAPDNFTAGNISAPGITVSGGTWGVAYPAGTRFYISDSSGKIYVYSLNAAVSASGTQSGAMTYISTVSTASGSVAKGSVASAGVYAGENLGSVISEIASAVKRVHGADSFMSSSAGQFHHNILPDSSGARDIGSTSAEWGDLFLAEGKSLYLGADQDVRLRNHSSGLSGLSSDSGLTSNLASGQTILMDIGTDLAVILYGSSLTAGSASSISGASGAFSSLSGLAKTASTIAVGSNTMSLAAGTILKFTEGSDILYFLLLEAFSSGSTMKVAHLSNIAGQTSSSSLSMSSGPDAFESVGSVSGSAYSGSITADQYIKFTKSGGVEYVFQVKVAVSSSAIALIVRPDGDRSNNNTFSSSDSFSAGQSGGSPAGGAILSAVGALGLQGQTLDVDATGGAANIDATAAIAIGGTSSTGVTIGIGAQKGSDLSTTWMTGGALDQPSSFGGTSITLDLGGSTQFGAAYSTGQKFYFTFYSESTGPSGFQASRIQGSSLAASATSITFSPDAGFSADAGTIIRLKTTAGFIAFSFDDAVTSGLTSIDVTPVSAASNITTISSPSSNISSVKTLTLLGDLVYSTAGSVSSSATSTSLTLDTTESDNEVIKQGTLTDPPSAMGTYTVPTTVTVTGNLTVTGTNTTIDSNVSSFSDHNIVLDQDNGGTAVTDGCGLTLEGGTGDDITFQQHATGDRMELKKGSSYHGLAVGKLHIDPTDSTDNYLDVSTDLQVIAAADIVLNPGGNNVKPGGDSEDDLGKAAVDASHSAGSSSSGLTSGLSSGQSFAMSSSGNVAVLYGSSLTAPSASSAPSGLESAVGSSVSLSSFSSTFNGTLTISNSYSGSSIAVGTVLSLNGSSSKFFFVVTSAYSGGSSMSICALPNISGHTTSIGSVSSISSYGGSFSGSGLSGVSASAGQTVGYTFSGGTAIFVLAAAITSSTPWGFVGDPRDDLSTLGTFSSSGSPSGATAGGSVTAATAQVAWRKLFVDDIDLNGQGSVSIGGFSTGASKAADVGKIVLDADDDTSIRSQGDDTIVFEAGDGDRVQITSAMMATTGSTIMSLGSTSAEWANLYLGDSSVLAFGADQDVSFTHSGTDLSIAGSGNINVTSTVDEANAIYLRANAGTSETIKIHSDQGTTLGSNTKDTHGGNLDGSTLDLTAAGNITFDSASNAAAFATAFPATSRVRFSDGTSTADVTIGTYAGGSAVVVPFTDPSVLESNGLLSISGMTGSSAKILLVTPAILLTSDVGGVKLNAGLDGSDTAIHLDSASGMIFSGGDQNDSVYFENSPLKLEQITEPSTVTGKLYNVSGELHWNGGPLTVGPTLYNLDLTRDHKPGDVVDFSGVTPVGDSDVTWSASTFAAKGNKVLPFVNGQHQLTGSNFKKTSSQGVILEASVHSSLKSLINGSSISSIGSSLSSLDLSSQANAKTFAATFEPGSVLRITDSSNSSPTDLVMGDIVGSAISLSSFNSSGADINLASSGNLVFNDDSSATAFLSAAGGATKIVRAFDGVTVVDLTLGSATGSNVAISSATVISGTTTLDVSGVAASGFIKPINTTIAVSDSAGVGGSVSTITVSNITAMQKVTQQDINAFGTETLSFTYDLFSGDNIQVLVYK